LHCPIAHIAYKCLFERLNQAATLLAVFAQTMNEARPASEARRPSFIADGLVEALTEREREVLHLLAAGCATRAIAQQLIISEGTVKRHVSNILGKLGVHSRLEAIARAHTSGLLT
jgi:DNA-binding NarL/FixJ family response regulator